MLFFVVRNQKDFNLALSCPEMSKWELLACGHAQPPVEEAVDPIL